MEKNCSKGYLCAAYLDRHLVPKNRRPVAWDEDSRSGRCTHVFVNQSWLETWEEWEPKARIALDAAAVELDAFNDTFTKRGGSFPISSKPHFVLEEDKLMPGGFSVWINALCPSRAEFERTVAEAQARIAAHRQPFDGVRVAEFGAPLPLLPIHSREFQAEPTNPDVAGLIEAL
jgi:hypothetical protein